ncbi:hypothetical protein [Paenibacillus odorifer]|uniref:hypothetical protein n=1 Tax=Paenibacillus odorifer TaxID=189426 RepID=UPI0015C3B142|nr:hypothetical protein [Paenibacillus odorifer]
MLLVFGMQNMDEFIIMTRSKNIKTKRNWEYEGMKKEEGQKREVKRGNRIRKRNCPYGVHRRKIWSLKNG